MQDFLRDLMAHAEWANAVFFHTWGKSSARDNEDLRKRLGHLVGVQEGFLKILRAESPGGRHQGPPPSYDDLKLRAQTSHVGLNDFVAELDHEQSERIAHIHWFPDPPCKISVAQALVQVAMHAQHHRGQCMTILKQQGGEPKDVDWIIWLWKQKPQGIWS